MKAYSDSGPNEIGASERSRDGRAEGRAARTEEGADAGGDPTAGAAAASRARVRRGLGAADRGRRPRSPRARCSATSRPRRRCSASTATTGSVPPWRQRSWSSPPRRRRSPFSEPRCAGSSPPCRLRSVPPGPNAISDCCRCRNCSPPTGDCCAQPWTSLPGCSPPASAGPSTTRTPGCWPMPWSGSPSRRCSAGPRHRAVTLIRGRRRHALGRLDAMTRRLLTRRTRPAVSSRICSMVATVRVTKPGLVVR